MAITPATISAASGSRRKSKSVGRGNSSGKGKTAGRGGKGQTARSGGGRRTGIRGLKSHIQKIPKLRGFGSQYDKMAVVDLSTIEKIAKENDVITPTYFLKRKMVSGVRAGVKIVANGELKKKVTVDGCFVSKTARELIEKAGGKVI